LACHRFHEYNHDAGFSLCDLICRISTIFYMHFHRSTVLILLFLCTISIAACDTPADKAVLLTPSIYEVDPLFETFYRRFGGEAVLGPAISHLFTYGPISYQYTPAGLMVHDPQAPEYARFSLAPLGLDLGVLEAAVQPALIPEVGRSTGAWSAAD
jgi:hypothetical protein